MINRIIFTGDLSDSRYSEEIRVAPGTRTIDIDIAWTGTGSPVGALYIKEAIHGDVDGDLVTYSIDGVNPLTATVNGAGVAHFRDLQITGPTTLWIYYARTGGGTGAVFYDGSSNTGNPPVCIFGY